jgi:hypothetical protein
LDFRNKNKFICLAWIAVFLASSLFAGAALAGNPGFSDDKGTLAPYTAPELVSGAGKKLLAIYMVGGDLEWEPGREGYNASADLDEIIKGYESLANKDALDVVVAFGGCAQDGWKGMKIANITQLIADSQDKRPVEDPRGTVSIYGNSDAYLYKAEGAHMGDESSLMLFLDYLKDGYRTHEKKFLVFWDHGGSYGGCCNDTNFNSDGLNLSEIDKGLKKNQAEMGMFDLIGFDQCLMGSAEVAKIIKNYAKYMIGSEELEPGHGWNWVSVVKGYSEKETVPDAAKEIIDNFVQDVHFYKSDGKTLGVLDLSRFDDLLSKIDPVASVLAQNMAAYSDAVIVGTSKSQAFGKSEKSDSKVSVDLIHFAENVKEKTSDADMKGKLDELIVAAKAFVIHAKNDGTRPNANGVSIAPPENNGGDAQTYTASESWLSFQNAYVALKSGDTTRPQVQDVNANANSGDFEWPADVAEKRSADDSMPPFLKGERAGFVAMPAGARRSLSGNVKGMSATFSDDNLESVTAIFGIEYEKTFIAVAEVEAYPTTVSGQYFTPAWNKEWYCVTYNPSQDTEWMPLTFEDRYEEDGKEYTVYVAEIDYYENGSGEAETAILELVVDENNVVVDHSVRTYEVLYDGEDDEEGDIRFDRTEKQIEVGDKIRFWTYTFASDDPEKYEWIETSDIITFTQSPEFEKEVLEFEDESGKILKYRYAMWAEDINNNGRMTELADVEGASAGSKDTGYLVTSDLWIKAVIHTEDKGAVGAVWEKGGQAATSRGDQVIWGYFYADPKDVSWGSRQNPDLFVKIWFDVSGRTDVNFFHVSVPKIEVFSDYKYDGTPDQTGMTTTTDRYIRQWYENGKSYMESSPGDGNPPSPQGNPSGDMTLNDLRIGAVINTVEKGAVNAVWKIGGNATTYRGDQVVWGHFYASPSDVAWGSENNPDLFVKIWFDISGKKYVNFFHVSVPDIEVFSDFPHDGVYDNKGTTILSNRYIRHEY